MTTRFAVLENFRFHTGETLGQLRIGFVTLGQPAGDAVLLLHGTGGSASSFLTEAFGGVLFGPGQPLDLERHFVVLPDSLGHGASAKPSDGMRMAFPRYNYDDMVHAQYRLATEVLGIRHFRLVMGNSMGGMHAWLWGVRHAGMMDALVPMACQPTAMSGRNWILRRMLVEMIRHGADDQQDRYEKPSRIAQLASLFFAFATNGGNMALQEAAPSRASADALLDARLAALSDADPDDLIYQWEASGDFDASQDLERISAQVLAINSADDERNPPETSRMAQTMERVKNGRCWLIPASAQTAGHGTTWQARWYAQPLAELMRVARRL